MRDAILFELARIEVDKMLRRVFRRVRLAGYCCRPVQYVQRPRRP